MIIQVTYGNAGQIKLGYYLNYFTGNQELRGLFTILFNCVIYGLF
jgi:hypothetical protein